MDEPSDTTVLALTARVVAAHVRHNDVEGGALPGLIRGVYGAFAGLPETEAPPSVAVLVPVPAPGVAPRVATLKPAVPPDQSVFDGHIICLDCGKHQKMLKRHLQSAHGLTPEAFRARWNLSGNYPLVAPAYAKQRSALAKKIGLGTKRLPVA